MGDQNSPGSLLFPAVSKLKHNFRSYVDMIFCLGYSGTISESRRETRFAFSVPNLLRLGWIEASPNVLSNLLIRKTGGEKKTQMSFLHGFENKTKFPSGSHFIFFLSAYLLFLDLYCQREAFKFSTNISRWQGEIVLRVYVTLYWWRLRSCS